MDALHTVLLKRLRAAGESRPGPGESGRCRCPGPNEEPAPGPNPTDWRKPGTRHSLGADPWSEADRRQPADNPQIAPTSMPCRYRGMANPDGRVGIQINGTSTGPMMPRQVGKNAGRVGSCCGISGSITAFSALHEHIHGSRRSEARTGRSDAPQRQSSPSLSRSPGKHR